MTRSLLVLAATLALLGALPRPVGAAECQVVADFAGSVVGEFPRDWKPRESRARDVYRVLEDGGLRFVRATAEGTGTQMGREFAWSLAAHPWLAWRWRPRVFPTGADEREGGRNDSALGVYAVFPHSPMTVKTVKWVWSVVAPPGATASASAGLTRMLVLRSGPPAGDGWVDEAVQVPRAYQQLFGEAPGSPRGIAVLSDADQTRSRAVGDYAAFRVCSSAPE
jgi:hypothetical protein